MWTIVRIAYRNIRRHGRRAVFLAAAVAFGVMMITLLNAFTAGAIDNIKGNLASVAGGHVFVAGKELVDGRREVDRIGDDEVLRAAAGRVQAPVQSVHRRSAVFATLIFGSKTTLQSIEGVDFADETDFSSGLQVLEGQRVFGAETDPRALILPKSAAERLGVQVGETVLARLTTVTGQQNVGEFRVAAVVDELLTAGFSGAYASLQYVNELIGLAPDEYQLFNLVLADVQQIDAAADQLAAALEAAGAPVERPFRQLAGREELEDESLQLIGQVFGRAAVRLAEEPWEGTKFSVTTLNEMMEPVVSAMTVLDAIARGIFVVLLLITAVGIMNTFRMVMLERVREIGTMRAFGMQKSTVRSIFLWEAALISLAGGAAGLVAAGVVALVVSRFSFAGVPGFEFFLDGGHVTFAATAADVAVNLAIVLVISLASAFLPANAAANLEPVEALGAHY